MFLKTLSVIFIIFIIFMIPNPVETMEENFSKDSCKDNGFYWDEELKECDTTPGLIVKKEWQPEELVPADEEMRDKANAYAQKVLCLRKGYNWNQVTDQCDHSKKTCLAESKWPPITDPKKGEKPKPYLIWDPSRNGCYIGPGVYRKWCERMKYIWNNDTQICTVTPKYCECQGLRYKNKDCHKGPVTAFYEEILGTTVGRSFANVITGQFGCIEDMCSKSDKKKLKDKADGAFNEDLINELKNLGWE